MPWICVIVVFVAFGLFVGLAVDFTFHSLFIIPDIYSYERRLTDACPNGKDICMFYSDAGFILAYVWAMNLQNV